MNHFLEITKKIQEFCNTTPSPDLMDEYLKNAGEIYKLHLESIVLEEEGVQSNDERVVKIYEKISEILDL